MKKNYYWIVGIVIIAVLAYLKYDYDQKEAEKARIEKLNNDVMKAASSGKERFNQSLEPIGETVIEGLRNVEIGVKSGED